MWYVNVLTFHCQLRCFLLVVLLIFLENISHFHGATDTPVLDFWWHLPWVSKPGWIPFACFLLCVILRFSSGMTPADCIEVSNCNVIRHRDIAKCTSKSGNCPFIISKCSKCSMSSFSEKESTILFSITHYINIFSPCVGPKVSKKSLGILSHFHYFKFIIDCPLIIYLVSTF